jgi:hypothetical protein
MRLVETPVKPSATLGVSQPASLSLHASRARIFSEPGFHVWCGSVIAWDGAWWLFYSRWPEAAGYDAWVTHSEIALARGPSPLGPFASSNHVLLPGPCRHAWERDVAHNPTVVAAGNRLYLAYMANHGPVHRHSPPALIPINADWWEHRNNQRIGVASAPHPMGPWETPDRPTLDASEAGWDSLLVNNPALFQIADGQWAMIYKGVATGPRPFGGAVLHGLAEGAHPGGPYSKVAGSHPFSDGRSPFPAEDPFAWYDSTAGVYRAIVKDMEGALAGVGRSLVFFESKDAREWNLSSLPAVPGSEIIWEDGKAEEFSRIERPQVTFDTEGRAVALQLACLPAGSGRVSFSLSIPLPPDFFENGWDSDTSRLRR